MSPARDRNTLRASDADRERTADRLRNAARAGRLSAEELEQRLEATFLTATYGELDHIVADLPSDDAPDRRHPVDLLTPRIALLFALAAALLIALVLIAATLGLGFRRSSSVAPHQAPPTITSRARSGSG